MKNSVKNCKVVTIINNYYYNKHKDDKELNTTQTNEVLVKNKDLDDSDDDSNDSDDAVDGSVDGSVDEEDDAVEDSVDEEVVEIDEDIDLEKLILIDKFFIDKYNIYKTLNRELILKYNKSYKNEKND